MHELNFLSVVSLAEQIRRKQLSPVELVESLDAFSPVGRYDRSALARLYGGRRVRMVRGWMNGVKGFESVTLLSPYPDASLTHLVAGTMFVRWTVPRGRSPASGSDGP